MLKLWKQRENIDIHTSLKSYLYKACYFEFVSNYSKQKTTINLISQLEIEAQNYIKEESTEDLKLLISKVNLAIEKLPLKCKQIFLMSKKEGLKYREIAEVLNISIKTVETQISRALSKLRANIKL